MTFETLRDAREACRIATFCNPEKAMVIDGVAHRPEHVFDVIMTSHADLAAGGWLRYVADTCVHAETTQDGPQIRTKRSDAYLGHAPLQLVARRLRLNL